VHASACYYGADNPAYTARDCYDDGAAAAQSAYMGEHDTTLETNEKLEDLTGVGERAFFRADSLVMGGAVYVQRGNLIAVTSLVGVPTSPKSCLIALARQVFAAR